MIYVLYGSEEYLLKQRVSKLVKENVKLEDSVAYLDMNEVSLNYVLEEAEMIPFFEDQKVMVVNHASFLSTKSEKGNELEFLLEYAHKSNPTTILIFVAEDGIDERKKLIKELRNYCKFEEFNALDEKDRKQYILGFLKKHKVLINDSAKNLLFTMLPQDMRSLQCELEKLSLYSQEIDERIVKLLITRPLEDDVFELVNAVVSKNMKRALVIWQDFLKLNKEPLALIGALASQFRFCYQASALRKEGYSEAEIAEQLECKVYRVTKTLSSIRGVSPDRFLRYLNELSQLDSSIKSGRVDKKLGFELFLIKVGGKQ